MKVSAFMTEAKKVIEDPANWTIGWFARNADGFDVSALSETATCFCSLGAIERYAKCELEEDLVGGVRSLSREAQCRLECVMGMAVEDFNDNHTHSEVMTMWDEAIKTAVEEGQ